MVLLDLFSHLLGMFGNISGITCKNSPQFPPRFLAPVWPYLNNLPSVRPVNLPTTRRTIRLPTVPSWIAFTSPMSFATPYNSDLDLPNTTLRLAISNTPIISDLSRVYLAGRPFIPGRALAPRLWAISALQNPSKQIQEHASAIRS